MGRKKKFTFVKTKMLAARCEESQVFLLEEKLVRERKTLQDVLNAFLASYINGTVVFSGSQIVGSSQMSASA